MRAGIAFLVLCVASQGSLGALRESGSTARAASFVDAQLASFRAQLNATPCRLGVVSSGEAVDIDYGWPRLPAEPSACDQHNMLNALRTDYITLPIPYAAFKASVEARLQPLARHEFRFYAPFGRNRSGHAGVEYLLRDGRTVLGIVHRRGQGRRASDAVVLSIFDVRSLPPTWSHFREGGSKEEDRYRFSVALNPAPFKFMRMWANTIGLRRNFQTDALDPQRVLEVEPSPELLAMGEGLAKLRWQRMDDMVTAFLPMKQGVDDKGDRAAAQLRADNRRREALVNPPGDWNWLAAGIIDGVNNATRTQLFWNARAAEAQARYFQAQHGCRPGFCGGGGNSGGGRDRDNRDNRDDRDDRDDGNDVRRRDADVARAPTTRTGSPTSGSAPEPSRVTVQRTADGNSHALLKKDELGPGQEQEACAAAREQANLNHALDGEEKASIRFGACGACKPTQWVFGAPNGSSWKMTCTVDYTVDIRESRSSGGSSSSR